MTPTKKDPGWLSPKQLGSQMVVMAMVGTFLLWAGSFLYVKRSEYEADRYNTSNTLTSMSKDLEFIKSALQRMENAGKHR